MLLASPGGKLYMEAVGTSGHANSMRCMGDRVIKRATKDVGLVVMDAACIKAILLLTVSFLSRVVCTRTAYTCF